MRKYQDYLKKQQKESKKDFSKNITFDYTGGVIYVNPVNQSKMPPTNLSVQFNLS